MPLDVEQPQGSGVILLQQQLLPTSWEIRNLPYCMTWLKATWQSIEEALQGQVFMIHREERSERSLYRIGDTFKRVTLDWMEIGRSKQAVRTDLKKAFFPCYLTMNRWTTTPWNAMAEKDSYKALHFIYISTVWQTRINKRLWLWLKTVKFPSQNEDSQSWDSLGSLFFSFAWVTSFACFA